MFPFDRWMARDQDDWDIVRELPVIREGGPEPLPGTSMSIHILCVDLSSRQSQPFVRRSKQVDTKEPSIVLIIITSVHKYPPPHRIVYSMGAVSSKV